jgi:hypothetical protein
MRPTDEKELYRLTNMLRDIDATLQRGSPLREGLKKSGLALICAFSHDLRPEIEEQFMKLGTALTQKERARFKKLGVDPDS